MSVEVLEVKIDALSKNEALEKARVFLNSAGQHSIFTPNPEMIVKAQSDVYFKQVLNSSSLSLCDGFGLWLAVRLSFRAKRSGVEKSRLVETNRRDSSAALGMTNKVERIPGVDFMLELCALAQSENKSIFLLGSGSAEVAQKTAVELKNKFPSLKIVGADKGIEIYEKRYAIGDRGDVSNIAYRLSPIKLQYNQKQHDDLISMVNEAKPEILFVAFGMGKQEKWIYENLAKMPAVKIAMGVGGSFDYISGIVPRAPLLMRKIGLEWLYRLVKQPHRAGRIWNATFKFVFLYVTKFFG